MDREQDAIEVEVVTIDGLAPVPVATPDEETPHQQQRHRQQNWQKWQGRIRRLDGRWWPLWLILGAVLLFLLLTVGVVLAVLFVIYLILRSFLLGIVRMFQS